MTASAEHAPTLHTRRPQAESCRRLRARSHLRVCSSRAHPNVERPRLLAGMIGSSALSVHEHQLKTALAVCEVAGASHSFDGATL